jgi:hypothetical protein
LHIPRKLQILQFDSNEAEERIDLTYFRDIYCTFNFSSITKIIKLNIGLLTQ